MTAVRGPFEVQREQLSTLVSHAAGEPRTVSVDFHPTPLSLALNSLVGLRSFRYQETRHTTYPDQEKQLTQRVGGSIGWIQAIHVLFFSCVPC